MCEVSLTRHACDTSQGGGSTDHGVQSRCDVTRILLAHAGEQLAGGVSSVGGTHTHKEMHTDRQTDSDTHTHTHNTHSE